MKKIINLLAFLAFVFAFVGCNSCNRSKKTETIKIGAILPLTGSSSVWGVPTKEGIELAAEIINKNGGINGKQVEIIFEDTKADPTTATTSIQKLITTDNVIAVIDNSNSSVTLAVAPIVEKNKIPLLVTGASSPKIKDAGDYIFRIWNSDALEGEFMADLAFNKFQFKNISILYVNNNYGVGLKDAFSESFVKLGGKTGGLETFGENSSDFKTQCSKVISTNPDAIYLVCYPKQGAILLKQLKELGNKKQVLGAVAFEDPTLLESAGESANGIIFPLPAPVDTTLQYYDSFKMDYFSKYNKPVPFLAAEGFDGLNVIIAALRMSGAVKPETLKKDLYKITNYKGVSGLISFDSFGEVHKPFGIKIVKNNKFEWYAK